MSRRGFTLIELLVVIAILGILVSLILPRFSDVRKNANINVCTANIYGLIKAMNIYEVKENVDNTWDWGVYGAADLVAWGYIADEPKCPEGDGVANDDYTLSGSGSTTAVVCTVNPTDHFWP